MENTNDTLIVGKHYPAIDGLRGFAVLLVVWFHASYFVHVAVEQPLEGASWYYYIFSVMGETGVDMFFVLSGFLITGILIDTRHHKNNIKHFYIRRVLRIFPLYYGFLFVFFAYFLFMFGLDDTQGGLDHGKIAVHLLYLQNWMFNHNADQFILLDHTWSLAVEEQFYLFWPLVFLSFYKRKNPRTAVMLCLSMIALSWGLRLYFGSYEAYKWAYTFTPSRVDELAFGALLSILCVQNASRLMRWRKVLPYIIAACFVIITAMMFAGAIQSGGNVKGAHDVSVIYGLIFFAVIYVSLLAYVFLSPTTNPLNRVLSTKPMLTLGKISYGLYIFHVPVMMIMARWLYNTDLGYWPSHIILLFGGGGVSFALAYVSYHFYEKRFLRLKHKLAPLEGS